MLYGKESEASKKLHQISEQGRSGLWLSKKSEKLKYLVKKEGGIECSVLTTNKGQGLRRIKIDSIDRENLIKEN